MGSQLFRKGERKGPTYNGSKWRGGGLPLRGTEGREGRIEETEREGNYLPQS